jgi:Uma2 family endonuclease
MFIYKALLFMEKEPIETNLFVEADFGKILDDRPFVIIGGQLLFFHEQLQRHVFTQISEDRSYKADECMQLPENSPYELINGKLIFMKSPVDIHQKISIRLSSAIFQYVDEKNLGEVRCAPLDVHFDEENIYQPDLMYISIARTNIIQRWVMDAPDFVVEILSEGNPKHDKVKKKKIYGKYGVTEYWIVYPKEEQIEVYHNKRNSMKLVQTVGKTGQIASKAITGFVLEVEKIFK